MLWCDILNSNLLSGVVGVIIGAVITIIFEIIITRFKLKNERITKVLEILSLLKIECDLFIISQEAKCTETKRILDDENIRNYDCEYEADYDLKPENIEPRRASNKSFNDFFTERFFKNLFILDQYAETNFHTIHDEVISLKEIAMNYGYEVGKGSISDDYTEVLKLVKEMHQLLKGIAQKIQ